MLATNFGSLAQMVTKVVNQNFAYQIWFCTRLVRWQAIMQSYVGLLSNIPLKSDFCEIKTEDAF